MAEAIVSLAVQSLRDLLVQQTFSLSGVRKKIMFLRNELEWMSAFLKDAEEIQDVDGGDERILHWVSEIRDAAYEAEDIIDKFILKQQEEGGLPKKVWLKAFIDNTCCIYKLTNLYVIGKEIDALKTRFDEIKRRRDAYGITNIVDGGEGSSRMNTMRLKNLRQESPYEYSGLHVVGFQKDHLWSSLMNEVLNDYVPHRCVVAIVGMCGLGKTTLARKLYNHQEIKYRFRCRAWVSVSNKYDIQDLLRRIIRSFEIPKTKDEFEMLDRFGSDNLERCLCDHLYGKRYLVVIDDIWDVEAWARLRRAIPDDKNGSRVIMTTRNKAVAEHLDERKHVHQLPFLTDDESWELFCEKAFIKYDHHSTAGGHNFPPSLERLARDMVSKCCGLPLAIVVLGELLSRQEFDVWPRLQEHILGYVIRDTSTPVKWLLALSFSDLPRDLKLCFLYLGLFPEDFEIEVEMLIRLWVAEGFIQSRHHEAALELEEVAVEYLNKLIDRNLIQTSRNTWWRTATCRVHNLLREFAIEKSKELNFFHILNAGNDIDSIRRSRGRRLSSQCEFGRFVSFDRLNELHLRTLLFFIYESAETSQLELLIKKIRLLRVLDIGNGIEFNPSQASRLPDAMGKLIYLRYLGLRGTGIKELPSSIGRLKALQTLSVDYITDTPVCLPDEICHAKELRHLVGRFKWPFRIENLTNLRTLDCVVVDGNDQMEFDSVNLVHLRKLQVFFRGIDKRYSLDSIGKLRSLHTLTLWVTTLSNGNFATLQPLSNCQHLLQLKLRGAKGNLPTDLYKFLPKLRYLLLDGEYTSDDPMPVLEKLVNLTILDLYNYEGDKFDCSASGFPRLEILRLLNCDHLQELHVEGEAMSALKGLEVAANVSLPERLRSIPAPKNWDASIYSNEWPY